MSNKEMDSKKNIKNKQTIIIAAAIVVILAIVILAVVVGMSKSGKDKGKETATDLNGNTVTTVNTETTVTTDKKVGNEQQGNNNSSEHATNKKGKNVNETNYWDDVSVYEDGDNGEKPTDKNGETVTESYPGEADGWSPIVSPDDLEQ